MERGNPQGRPGWAVSFAYFSLTSKKSKTPGRAGPAIYEAFSRGRAPGGTFLSLLAQRKEAKRGRPLPRPSSPFRRPRVPCVPQTFCGRAETRFAQTSARLIRKMSAALRREQRGSRTPFILPPLTLPSCAPASREYSSQSDSTSPSAERGPGHRGRPGEGCAEGCSSPLRGGGG
jgi:hypothetical protein